MDASRKAQLITFLCTLLEIKGPSFPVGYVAIMVHKGYLGTYLFSGATWVKVN